MRKKLILISLTLLISLGIYYYFELRRIDFPNFDYDHAALLSIDKKILDTTSNESKYSVMLPTNGNGTNGASFLNDKGIPYHNYYSKKNITTEQEVMIHNCLSPMSIFGEKRNDCLPIYRDIVVYYDKNDKPVGWMSVCFECGELYFSPENMGWSNSSIDCLEDLFKTL